MSIFDLSPEDVILLATVLGLKLSKGLTLEQQVTLGNFFIQIGQTIVTYNGQQAYLEAVIENFQKPKNGNAESNC